MGREGAVQIKQDCLEWDSRSSSGTQVDDSAARGWTDLGAGLVSGWMSPDTQASWKASTTLGSKTMPESSRILATPASG